MKKSILIAAVIAVAPATVLAKNDKPKEDKKVTICHATSSASNPWTRIVVSENAIGGHFDNPGTPKAGHEDDVLLQGDVSCPAPQPVDVCINIPGIQETIPEGYYAVKNVCALDESEPEKEPENPGTPETPKDISIGIPKVATPDQTTDQPAIIGVK